MAFLLVGFSARHVLQTANQLEIGEPCERGFPRQIGGTVPAVSPKDTSAHPFTALRRRHCTFLTHLTVHDEAGLAFTSLCPVGPVEHVEGTNFTSCASLVRHGTLFRGAAPLSFTKFRNVVPWFVSRCRATSFGIVNTITGRTLSVC